MAVLPYRDALSVYDSLGVLRIFAKCRQLAVVLVNGVRIVSLAFQVDPCVVRVLRKPRGAGREACMCLVTPLERCAGVVAAVEGSDLHCFFRSQSGLYGDFVLIQSGDVVDLVDGSKFHILHADFLSLIDERKSAEHDIHRGQQLFTRRSHFTIRNIEGNAARFIVVLDDIREESDVADLSLALEAAVPVVVRRDAGRSIPAEVAFTEGRLIEIKHGREVAAVTDKERKVTRLFVEDFACGESIVFGKGAVAHFSEKLADAGRFLEH